MTPIDPSSSTESTMDTHSDTAELRKSLEAALDEVGDLKIELAEARSEIERLKNENAKLKAAGRSNDGEGQVVSEDVEDEQKEESKGVEEDVSSKNEVDKAVDRPSDEENSVSDNGNADVPTDEDNAAAASDSEDDGGNSSDEDEDGPPTAATPTDEADDIRLRAARTLIWADSAIKRAEAMKDQAQQASANGDLNSASAAGTPIGGSLRGSIMSGEQNSVLDTPMSSSRKTRRLPDTVQIAASTTNDDSDDEDDASVLSEDDYSARGSDKKAGPLANIRQFLEDKMDDVADRLVAPLDDSPNDSSDLPPRSPTSFKYCNDAMKKKMNASGCGGFDDNDSRSTARTPVSARTPRSSTAEDGGSVGTGSAAGSGGGGTGTPKPKPMMNEAMMRLSQEKKRKGGGLGSRLFS